jgi:predicted AAA+ superfamily ATPase
MVDINNKLIEIEKLIKNEEYFTINRSRQYGKTTTLSLLEKKLNNDYIFIRTSFEGIGEDIFESEKVFCNNFFIF